MQAVTSWPQSAVFNMTTFVSSLIWPTSEDLATLSELRLLQRIDRVKWTGSSLTHLEKLYAEKDPSITLPGVEDPTEKPPSNYYKVAELRKVPVDQDNYINTFSMIEPEQNSKKKVLVMAHGFGVGLGLFYRNYQALADLKGWDVYSIDWLGMGRSSRPPYKLRKGHNQTAEEHLKESEDFFIESFEAWRKELNIEKFHLLGHSLGGYLSTVYALKYPERVEKLILASPVGIPESPYLATTPEEEKRILEEQQQSLQDAPTELRNRPKIPSWVPYVWNILHVTPQWIVRMAGPYGPKLIGGYVNRRFAHLDPEEQKDVQDYMYHIASMRGSGEHAVSTILSFGAYARSPLLHRLPQVKVPISFTYGEIDWMDHRHAAKLESKLQFPTRIHVLPKVGHQLFIEKPEQFDQFLIDELSTATP